MSHEVDENCALPGHYTAISGNFLTDVSGQPIGTVFRVNLLGFFTLKDETDRLSRNVGTESPHYAT